MTQTLVVSDIDDTLKIVDVLDWQQAVKNAFRTDQRFFGMNELLQQLVYGGSQTQMVYLSNAPEWLMAETHQLFLSRGKFPEGIYFPKEFGSGDNHKLMSLRRLVKEFSPQNLILIGDNGEQDSAIYHQIYSEQVGQRIKVFQFIHLVYDHPIYPEQIGFASPIEIALPLYERGFLQFDHAKTLVESVVQQVMNEFPKDEEDLVFPEFMRCQGYKWSLDKFKEAFRVLSLYKTLIENRCSEWPFLVYQNSSLSNSN